MQLNNWFICYYIINMPPFDMFCKQVFIIVTK